MIIALLVAQLTVAQLPGQVLAALPARREQQRASTVVGVVRDSLAGTPLAGAKVQLVGADSTSRFGQTAVSDAQGFYSFADVPSGTYTLGFFHSLLDSLGIEPKLQTVKVSGQRELITELAIPSAASVSAAVCGYAGTRANPLLMGVVRDAKTGEPVSGVTVAGEWVELAFTGKSLARKTPRRVVTTRDNGWYAICGVPSPGSMTVTASRSADSTDAVEVQVPNDGFARRELFLGSARTVVVNAPPVAAAEANVTRTLRVGDGRLSGTVTAANRGKPIVNAQVSVANGPSTRTNERGEWTLVDAPAGTRALEVRAVGYYPERRTVDVVAGSPAISVSLATFKSVLDTMKVLANYDLYSNLAGFRERRRAGTGRYLGSEDIARRNALVTSDLFLMIPGVYVEFPLAEDLRSEFSAPEVGTETPAIPEKTILIRGMTTRRCIPSVYLNGQWMQNVTSTDIDMIIKPESLYGIEIYTSVVPPQFQPGLSGCGSIVFWTK